MGEQGIHTHLTPPIIHIHEGTDREKEVSEAIKSGRLTLESISIFFGHQTTLELLSMRKDETLVLEIIDPSNPVIKKHFHGSKQVVEKNYPYRLVKP